VDFRRILMVRLEFLEEQITNNEAYQSASVFSRNDSNNDIFWNPNLSNKIPAVRYAGIFKPETLDSGACDGMTEKRKVKLFTMSSIFGALSHHL